jgi:hypothetical protein
VLTHIPSKSRHLLTATKLQQPPTASWQISSCRALPSLFPALPSLFPALPSLFPVHATKCE